MRTASQYSVSIGFCFVRQIFCGEQFYIKRFGIYNVIILCRSVFYHLYRIFSHFIHHLSSNAIHSIPTLRETSYSAISPISLPEIQAEPTNADLRTILSFYCPFPLPLFQFFQFLYRFLYQRMSRIIRNIGQKLLSPLTSCQRILCIVIKGIVCVMQGKLQRRTHLRRAATES